MGILRYFAALGLIVFACFSNAQAAQRDVYHTAGLDGFFEELLKLRKERQPSPAPSPPVAQPPASTENLNERLIMLAEQICTAAYPPQTKEACYDKLFHGMGSALDAHSQYMNEKEYRDFSMNTNNRLEGVGIEIAKPSPNSHLLVLGIISGGSAGEAGVMIGDKIITIDGKSTFGMTVPETVKALRGAPGTRVVVEIEREGSMLSPLSLERRAIALVQITSEILYADGRAYGYIKTEHFGKNFADELRTHIVEMRRKVSRQLSGLIISVENNPGGSLQEAISAVDLFLDAPSIVLVRQKDGIHPYGSRINEWLIPTVQGDITNGLPLLVLVNGRSVSASEIFSGALKHFGRAVIAGPSGTFQKGNVQGVFTFPGGDALKLTESEYLIGTMDSWVPVQCFGVVPDLPIPPFVEEKESTRITECMMASSIRSAGPMPNAPWLPNIRERNPGLYNAGVVMLRVYMEQIFPKKQQEVFRKKNILERNRDSRP